jgi:group I intron endonuclease
MISAARIAKLEKSIRLRARLTGFGFSRNVPQFQAGVYRIRNTKTDDCYIGAASNLRARMSMHRHLLALEAHTELLQRAFKYHAPESFVFEVLIICAREHLAMFETACIERFQPAYNTRPARKDTAK